MIAIISSILIIQPRKEKQEWACQLKYCNHIMIRHVLTSRNEGSQFLNITTRPSFDGASLGEDVFTFSIEVKASAYSKESHSARHQK